MEKSEREEADKRGELRDKHREGLGKEEGEEGDEEMSLSDTRATVLSRLTLKRSYNFINPKKGWKT